MCTLSFWYTEILYIYIYISEAVSLDMAFDNAPKICSVVWIFFHRLGMILQLTIHYFSEWLKPPTRNNFLHGEMDSQRALFVAMFDCRRIHKTTAWGLRFRKPQLAGNLRWNPISLIAEVLSIAKTCAGHHAAWTTTGGWDLSYLILKHIQRCHQPCTNIYACI